MRGSRSGLQNHEIKVCKRFSVAFARVSSAVRDESHFLLLASWKVAKTLNRNRNGGAGLPPDPNPKVGSDTCVVSEVSRVWGPLTKDGES